MSLVWETEAENTGSSTGQNERRVVAEALMSKMLRGHIQMEEALGGGFGRRQPSGDLDSDGQGWADRLGGCVRRGELQGQSPQRRASSWLPPGGTESLVGLDGGPYVFGKGHLRSTAPLPPQVHLADSDAGREAHGALAGGHVLA